MAFNRQPVLDGFNYDTMIWEGFDVEFCRALSAALFYGDPTHIDFYEFMLRLYVSSC